MIKKERQKICVIIYFVHFENAGSLGCLLREFYTIKYVHASKYHETEEYFELASLVLIMGGPIGVNDASSFPFLTSLIKGVEKRIRHDKPVLGICLGAQIIIKAMGGLVYKGQSTEIGWKTISITKEGLKSSLKYLDNIFVLHWHDDTFSIPSECKRLAFSDVTENQAFSFGNNILGCQFHFEVLPKSFELWSTGHYVELKIKEINLNKLRNKFDTHAEKLQPVGRKVLLDYLNNFIESSSLL